MGVYESISRIGMNKFKDTLFKRYDDVSFLFSTMDLEDLWNFIREMYLEIREEKIEQLYFANPLQDKDYKTFREEIIKRSEEASKTPEQKRAEARKASEEVDKFLADMRKGVTNG